MGSKLSYYGTIKSCSKDYLMNVTALFSDSSLSRMRASDEGSVGTVGGVIARPASFRVAGEGSAGADGLRAVTGNRIPAPHEGGKIEQPRGLAADRMEQVQADIPQGGAESGIMAMLIKFSEAQGLAR